MPTFAVLTSSDRAAAGERSDTSGDVIIDIMVENRFRLVRRLIVPDDEALLAETITKWSDDSDIDLILTTGGTGLGPRDVVPEVMERVLDYEVPGIAEAMRVGTLSKTPMAMLSRAKVGARRQTLILNLPGSPNGVRDCLEVALPVISHAIEILQGHHRGNHPIPLCTENVSDPSLNHQQSP